MVSDERASAAEPVQACFHPLVAEEGILLPTVVQRSLLEKLAQDNGFDAPAGLIGDWLGFASTQVPLKLWLGVASGGWVVAFSQSGVAVEFLEATGIKKESLPPGAVGACEVEDLNELHRIVRRAYQLSATLPDELLHEFERQTKDLPLTTEVERLVVQRVGQNVFRDGLVRYWEGRCAVTGLSEPELLRASHIKPWSRCDTDQERLNVFNGLLLAVHLDAAFDRGFITFDDAGRIVLSPCFSTDDAARLGFLPSLMLRRLEDQHRRALAWHRANVFQRGPKSGGPLP